MPEGIDGQDSGQDRILNLDEYGEHKIPTTVYGKDGEVTLNDLVRRGQKDIAAEQRLAELREREEELEEDLDAVRALKVGWRDQNPETFVKGLTSLGVPEDDAKRVVYGQSPANAVDDGGGEPATRGNEKGSEGENMEQQFDTFMQMFGQTEFGQAISEMYTNFQGSKKKQKVVSESREVLSALDNDPELSIIMDRMGDEGKKSIREWALTEVNRRRKDFPTWGPRPIQAGLSDLKRRLSDTGISTEEPTTTGVGKTGSPESGVHLASDAQSVLSGNDGSGDDDYSLYSEDAGKSFLKDIARNAGLMK